MLAVELLSGALSSWGHARMRLGELREVASLLTAAHAIYLLGHLAASAVWIGAWSALAALPAWVGARRAAKAARGLAVVALVLPFVGTATSLVLGRILSATNVTVYYAAVAAVGAVVHTAYVLLVARAIERATTAVDPRRPVRLVPWALFASALAFGSILSGAFTALLGHLGVWFVLAGFVIHGALASTLAWGWARGLRTASAVLAAQPWPEGHRGGPDAP